MTSQLEPEEVQAIADAMAAPTGARAEVAERDFRIPRRLSLEVVKKLEESLRTSVPSFQRALQAIVPTEIILEPTSVREITARGLFDSVPEPFLIARYLTGRAPGWVVWEPESAIAAVQAALGMPVSEDERIDTSRELSYIERRMMGRILEALLRPVAERFQLSVEGLSIAEKPDEIGSWEDEGPDADAHRLCVDLNLTAAGRTSNLTLYMPGFLPAEVDLDETGPDVSSPGFMHEVAVDVRALFDAVQVPLSDLLDIEVGDILPLGPVRSSRVTLVVDQTPVAHAKLGRNYERLAVRLTDMIAHEELGEPSHEQPPSQPTR
jgi:flagellar motor switch protein FliM